MSDPRARVGLKEVAVMYEETDTRALQVLARALASGSRATRLRAVAMLARVACEPRERWLAEALGDPDSAVRDTATIVSAWTHPSDEAVWPQREDPAFDRVAPLDPAADAQIERSVRLRWQWEYAVEVWRADGLLVGVYLSTSCREDDEHAKRIALGQAILASSAPGGDAFDPADAAAFIVGKRQVRNDASTRRQ
jgi:hypothetical protein